MNKPRFLLRLEQLEYRDIPGAMHHALYPTPLRNELADSCHLLAITCSDQPEVGARRTDYIESDYHDQQSNCNCNNREHVNNSAYHSITTFTISDNALPTAYLLMELSQSALESMTNVPFFFSQSTSIDEKGGDYPPEIPICIGNIDIACETETDTYLPEDFEQGTGQPGWLMHVNANDDNSNGWQNANPPGPNSAYTPDREDATCPGGDPDLQKFKITLDGFDDGDPSGNIILTYSEANIKVFKSRDKSGFIASGTVLGMEDMTYVYRDPFGLGGNAYLNVYAEGIESSLDYKDCNLRVEYLGTMNLMRTSDEVDVTVFGGVNVGKFTGDQFDDNQVRFYEQNRQYNFSDSKDGLWSWSTEPKSDGVHNCMEHQVKVTPLNYITLNESGDIPQNDLVSFNITRERYGADWTKAAQNQQWVRGPLFKLQWESDEVDQSTKDLTLSPSSSIYYIDAPGYTSCFNAPGLPPVQLPYQAEQFANFRNIAWINLYGKSYNFTEYFTWHSQVVTTTVTVPRGTGLAPSAAAQQKLASGWITIPANPIEPS